MNTSILVLPSASYDPEFMAVIYMKTLEIN